MGNDSNIKAGPGSEERRVLLPHEAVRGARTPKRERLHQATKRVQQQQTSLVEIVEHYAAETARLDRLVARLLDCASINPFVSWPARVGLWKTRRALLKRFAAEEAKRASDESADDNDGEGE